VQGFGAWCWRSATLAKGPRSSGELVAGSGFGGGGAFGAEQRAVALFWFMPLVKGADEVDPVADCPWATR
jgi:hypothetical protein